MSGSCDSMDCSVPGSSILRILQARILEWVAIPFSTQGLSPGLLHCRQILCHLGHQSRPNTRPYIKSSHLLVCDVSFRIGSVSNLHLCVKSVSTDSPFIFSNKKMHYISLLNQNIKLNSVLSFYNLKCTVTWSSIYR